MCAVILQRHTEHIDSETIGQGKFGSLFPIMHRGQARTRWVWRCSQSRYSSVLFALCRPADVTAGGKERNNWSNYSSNYRIISLCGGEQEGGWRRSLCVSFLLLGTPPGHISKHYLSALPVQISPWLSSSFILSSNTNMQAVISLPLSLCAPLDGEKRRDLKEAQPYKSANEKQIENN